MPLIMAPTEVDLRITGIAVDGETKRHLADMGIIPGQKVNLVSSKSGTVIIRLKEGRVALDGNIARKILVA